MALEVLYAWGSVGEISAFHPIIPRLRITNGSSMCIAIDAKRDMKLRAIPNITPRLVAPFVRERNTAKTIPMVHNHSNTVSHGENSKVFWVCRKILLW